LTGYEDQAEMGYRLAIVTGRLRSQGSEDGFHDRRLEMRQIERVWELMYLGKRTFGIFAPFFNYLKIKIKKNHAGSNGRSTPEIQG
jgi:hypothetical protein